MSPQWAASAILATAAIMLWAALSGARDLRVLAVSIDAYKLLPEGAGRGLALPLLLAESACGVLLLLPGMRLAGAVIASALMLLFIFAIALNMWRGTTDFDCGCAGSHALRPGAALLLRNTALLCVLLMAVTMPASAPDVGSIAGAIVLLLAWCGVNAVIAATQWPHDD
jgi:hypothetical protein